MARIARVAIKDFELIQWLAEQATKRLIHLGVDQKMARGALRRLAKALKTINSWKKNG